VPGLGQRLHSGVERLVGVVGVAQIGKHTVIAVDVGLTERLVGHRQDPAPLLARALGDELLGPQAEAGDRLRDNEGQLVAAPQGELAERQTEPQARVRVRGIKALAGLLGHAGSIEQRGELDADQRGGDQAEVRQR